METRALFDHLFGFLEERTVNETIPACCGGFYSGPTKNSTQDLTFSNEINKTLEKILAIKSQKSW